MINYNLLKVYLAIVLSIFTVSMAFNFISSRSQSFQRQAFPALMNFRPLSGLSAKPAVVEASKTKRTTKKSLAKHWVLRFDGGSRGNPGLGGAGAVLYAPDKTGGLVEVWWEYYFVGADGVTNNVAEYTGLIRGLMQKIKMKSPGLIIEGDSLLVVRQIEGDFAVRSEKLLPLFEKAQKLLVKLKKGRPEGWSLIMKHIPRGQNGRADELSNIAMDNKSSKKGIVDSDIVKKLLLSTDNEIAEKVKATKVKSGVSSGIKTKKTTGKSVAESPPTTTANDKTAVLDITEKATKPEKLKRIKKPSSSDALASFEVRVARVEGVEPVKRTRKARSKATE
jgi:ribonuclease HI